MKFKPVLIALLICLGTSCTNFSERQKSDNLDHKTALHLLHSTVRITTGNFLEGIITGTGVVVYSGRRPDNIDPRYYTYILTCAHVVDNADFSITVERFHYLDGSTIIATSSYDGSVVILNKEQDFAVIQVMSSKPFSDSVSIIKLDSFYNLPIYLPIYAVGCGLGKQPYITNGNISSFCEEDRTSDFSLQLTAATIFGNSGGGIFDSNGQLLGLVQAISMVNSQVPYPHIARAIPIWNIALFLTEKKLGFIVGVDNSNIDEFYRNANLIKSQQKQDSETLQFKKDLLDALRKLTAPITSNVAPNNSSVIISPAPISSKTWH